jgi:hypothetical protein
LKKSKEESSYRHSWLSPYVPQPPDSGLANIAPGTLVKLKTLIRKTAAKFIDYSGILS